MKLVQKLRFRIFKEFIKGALYLDDFKEFHVPNGIYFAPINYNTGNKLILMTKILYLKHLRKKILTILIISN